VAEAVAAVVGQEARDGLKRAKAKSRRKTIPVFHSRNQILNTFVE